MSYNSIRNTNANVPLLQRNAALVNEVDTIYNGAPDETEDSADCYRTNRESIKAVRIA